MPLWRPRRRGDFDQEIESHLLLDADRFVAEGLSPAEAKAAARRAFGNVTAARERFYESRRVLWVDDLRRDIWYAIRGLIRTPGFTAVALISLALGIGANTAIFSVVNALVLRVLPVREPNRLFVVSTSAGSNQTEFSYATFAQIRDQVEAFDGATGYTACCGKSIVDEGGHHGMVDRQFVTGEFFEMLGIRPYRGRMLTPADDTVPPSHGPVAVVSYRYWRDHLGARDLAVGGPMTIDGTLVTIVGVTPPNFFGVDVGRSVDVIAPFHLAPQLTSTSFDDHTVWLNVMVRARQGIDMGAAAAAMRAAQPQIRAAAMPKNFPSAKFLPDAFALEPAATGVSSLRERFARPLAALFGIVALVLVIACANVANLLLARSTARRQELSVRVALGASRWRLAQQLLTESLVLASISSAAGLVLASWARRMLLSLLSNPRAPILLDAAIDGRVLTFTIGAAVATALLFGAGPALRATAIAPIDALRSHGRTVGTQGGALSRGVIIINVALTVLLVVAAGLFVQTFERLARVPLGFNPDGTLVVSVTASTVQDAERPTLVNRLAKAVRAVPGVNAAGGALNPPIVGDIGGADLVVATPGSWAAPDATRISHMDVITPGWFASYGISIKAGRDFDDRDLEGPPAAMIVNEAFVHQLFPGRNVIGMPLALAWRIRRGDVPFGLRTIVGVAVDSVYRTPREPVQPMVFVPLASHDPLAQKDFFIGVRATSGSPSLLEHQVASAMTSVSGDVAFSIEPLRQQTSASLTDNRAIAVLSAFFGVLALVLAAVGLYGVIAYGVAQRKAEIGVRIALGAKRRSIVITMLAHVATPVGIGVVAGVALSVWAATIVRSLLYGLEPSDPATLTGAVTVLATVATIAGWLPAYRASRLDPASVLKEL